jgi:hypothetical protein
MERGTAGSSANRAGRGKAKSGSGSRPKAKKSAKPSKPAKPAKAAKAARPPAKPPAKKASKPVKAIKTLPAAKAAKPPAKPLKAVPAPVKGRHAAGPEEPEARLALKERLAKLSSATGKIGGLKRALNKNFFDVGVILNHIRDERLYEVKGYGSFEAFIEREIDINKIVCLRSARIAETMLRDAAVAAGFDRAAAAVAALDGDAGIEQTALRPGGIPGALLPIHKQ